MEIEETRRSVTVLSCNNETNTTALSTTYSFLLSSITHTRLFVDVAPPFFLRPFFFLQKKNKRQDSANGLAVAPICHHEKKKDMGKLNRKKRHYSFCPPLAASRNTNGLFFCVCVCVCSDFAFVAKPPQVPSSSPARRAGRVLPCPPLTACILQLERVEALLVVVYVVLVEPRQNRRCRRGPRLCPGYAATATRRH